MEKELLTLPPPQWCSINQGSTEQGLKPRTLAVLELAEIGVHFVVLSVSCYFDSGQPYVRSAAAGELPQCDWHPC